MEERIVDTCCVLNLYASGNHLQILNHFGSVFVSEHVLQEALWIRCIDQDPPHHLIPKQVDLNEAIDGGFITLCKFENQLEIELFVDFAKQLDDGEASVLAIAKSRKWTIATDDKKARRIATEQEIKVISTSEMIFKWANSQSIDDKEIAEVLGDIQQFGKFRPRRNDPLYDWWLRLTSGND